MLFTTHIFSPNNTGSPAYTICGQASSVVSFTNITLSLGISMGSSTVTTLFTTTNLSTFNPASSYISLTYGNYIINFDNFTKDATTGRFTVRLKVISALDASVVTWEKFNLHIDISKSGYYSYSNVIELYGYDVGNDTTLSYTGNVDFDIKLVNKTNNEDSLGRQTKAYSSLAALRRPFSNEIHFYNLVGTQGDIVYTIDDPLVIGQQLVEIGTGNSGIICNEADLVIKETVNVKDSSCTIISTCATEVTCLKVNWLPEFTTTSTCPESCGDCINNIAETTVSAIIDYTNVTPFKIEENIVFLTQFMIDNVIFTLYNSSGNEIAVVTEEFDIVDYTTWVATPSTFLTPITFTFIPSELGDNVVKICNTLYEVAQDLVNDIPQDLNNILIQCCNTLIMPTCNWWTVTKSDTCGKYIFNNCSATTVEITLQKLQDDKTFADIVTVEVNPFESTTFEFDSDGVYLIVVPDALSETGYSYYTLPSFCAWESCWLAFLQGTICNPPSTTCDTQDLYTFFAFMINSHSFLMQLNAEMNFNFIYTVLDSTKINELYTLSSYISRLSEYCNPATGNCLPCSE